MRGTAKTTWIALVSALVLILAVSIGRAQDKYFIIVHDKASVEDLIPKLTNGAGKAELEEKDVYKEDDDGKAALLVTGEGGDGQKFNPNVPGWNFQIVRDPKKEDEFEYITFAWKKVGGAGIQLQLSAQGNWGHRYHAGANEKNWNPSIQVSPDMPEDWEIHTRNLVDDWGEFTLTGIAFTAWSLDFGIWDHVVLHQSPEDPLAAKAVDPKGKAAMTWATLKTQ